MRLGRPLVPLSSAHFLEGGDDDQTEGFRAGPLNHLVAAVVGDVFSDVVCVGLVDPVDGCDTIEVTTRAPAGSPLIPGERELQEFS